MSNPERGRVVYVTSSSLLKNKAGADDEQWLIMDVPFGLITPPMVKIWRPMVGEVVFYHASSYQVPVPAAARLALKRAGGEES